MFEHNPTHAKPQLRYFDPDNDRFFKETIVYGVGLMTKTLAHGTDGGRFAHLCLVYAHLAHSTT